MGARTRVFHAVKAEHHRPVGLERFPEFLFEFGGDRHGGSHPE
jgi:hypothetical protein